jgi:transcriptional accessory protein Tex/SPT6
LIYLPFKDAMRKKDGIKRDKGKRAVNRSRKD